MPFSLTKTTADRLELGLANLRETEIKKKRGGLVMLHASLPQHENCRQEKGNPFIYNFILVRRVKANRINVLWDFVSVDRGGASPVRPHRGALFSVLESWRPHGFLTSLPLTVFFFVSN